MTIFRLCAATIALSGCGLIDSNVTDFDLTLKDKQFTVDASGWQVDQNQADALLSFPCTNDQMCSSGAMAACAENCSGSCNMSSSTCDLGLDVGLYKTIDLITEQPELKEINERAVIEVEVDGIEYTIAMNTLNVETPAMRVLVAPMSIMDPNDPMAKHIGTIEAVPAGATILQPRQMTFTADGRQALKDTMGTYKNPFNIIVGSQIVMTSGDTVPTGRLDAAVTIKAHAGI